MILKGFTFFLSLFCVSYIYAGPHTIQKGETLMDIAKLYNIPFDSIINANPNTEVYAGLTIEIPLSTLVYDLGNSDLFRYMCLHDKHDKKKGDRLYSDAHEKQMKLDNVREKKRQKLEEEITNEYARAITYGNSEALYQLGRQKVHGRLYGQDGYPTFSQTINNNPDEFQKGIEFLQIAALVSKNKKALAELAVACGHENSPIRNPYLCLGMLEQYHKELGADVGNLICYMYENGYGIRPNLLQAYIYCPSAELTSKSGNKTHREKILEKIEEMPKNFESSRYGVGLDSKTLMSIGLSNYHDKVLAPNGFFWLHRAARLNDADANWALASILHNGNFGKGAVGDKSSTESQILCFVQKAADNGKEEAKEYLKEYRKQQEIKAAQERKRELERQRQLEEKRQRRRQMWANIANAVVQTAAQAYVAVESSKMQSRQMQRSLPHSMQRTPAGQMTDAQWMAKNQLAMQQIAQYTMNKVYADWTGTPMMPTNMSAVDLGTDMSPGSPLWNWGMQQQINTIATQNSRMSCEIAAYYKRQADNITQQITENPFQPIAGYVDRDGNWVSNEMVAAGLNDKNENVSENRNSGFERIRLRNKEYYSERYGYKDCKSCHGYGDCSTCDGKGYNYNELGLQGTHECPNCLRVNGRASGKCRLCQGTGKVYGLK